MLPNESVQRHFANEIFNRIPGKTITIPGWTRKMIVIASERRSASSRNRDRLHFEIVIDIASER